jgi:mannosyltransferase
MRARHVQILTALTVAGALLRFATLGPQSFSGDEGVTVALVEMGLGEMLDAIPDSESTPPLYYLLAWLWAKVAGTGEIGIRSLSALLGTAAVPVAYAAGRELASRRAGLIAAALTAANPLLVWYSQEARAYVLLVLLAGLSLWLLGRCLRAGGRRELVLWGLVSALALLTHYYAAFLVVPEAVWLVASAGAARRRAALAAAGAVLLTGAALLPLALDQRDTGNFTAFIEDSPLTNRVKEVPKKFLLGEQGAPGGYGSFVEALLVPALLLAALAALLLLRDRERTRGAVVALSVGAAAIGVPLAMALAGFDYFAAYLLTGAWVALAVAAGAGFAASRLGLVSAAALAILFAAASIAVALDPDLQRPDYEAAAAALGEPQGTRALVTTPDNAPAPLAAYGRELSPIPPAGARVNEIVLLGMDSEDGSWRARRGWSLAHGPAPGMALVDHVDGQRFTLLRFRSRSPVRVTGAPLAESKLGDADPAVVLER